MIKLFLGNKTIVLLLLPLYLFVYQGLNYFYPFYSIDLPSNFGFWTDYIELEPLSSSIGASILVLFNSYRINLLINRTKFLERNTFLIGLLYLVLMSLFHSSYYLNGILISHFMILLMIGQFFELNQHEDGRQSAFNSFFYAGLASSFNPVLLLITPLLILPVLVMRPYKITEIFVSVLAYLTPFVYVMSFSYIFDVPVDISIIVEQLEFSENKDFLFVLASVCILLVLGIFSLIQKSQKTTINSKKQFRILLILAALFICCALYYIISYQQLDQLSLVVIPVSIFLTFSFLSKTYNLAALVLFYVVFAYSVIKFFLFLPNQNL